VNHFTKNYESSTRLEQGCCGKGICLTQRNVFRKGEFLLGLVGSLALDNFCWCRYDALVGYESKNLDVYVSHNS